MYRYILALVLYISSAIKRRKRRVKNDLELIIAKRYPKLEYYLRKKAYTKLILILIGAFDIPIIIGNIVGYFVVFAWFPAVKAADFTSTVIITIYFELTIIVAIALTYFGSIYFKGTNEHLIALQREIDQELSTGLKTRFQTKYGREILAPYPIEVLTRSMKRIRIILVILFFGWIIADIVYYFNLKQLSV